MKLGGFRESATNNPCPGKELRGLNFEDALDRLLNNLKILVGSRSWPSGGQSSRRLVKWVPSIVEGVVENRMPQHCDHVMNLYGYISTCWAE